MFQVSIHSGRVIERCASEQEAIQVASWNARQLGKRVNVYPVDDAGKCGTRIVSCYRAGWIYESEIADLPHGEYMARHETMAQASNR